MQANFDPRELRSSGYCIARGVFSHTEIASIRNLLEAARQRLRAGSGFDGDPAYPNLMMLRGDILGVNELRPVDFVVFDERVISAVKQCLGTDIVYHGDSTVQWGAGPRGFHKDCADRSDPSGVDWQGDYGIVRLGIYLQDHGSHSGGLKVRTSSHRHVSHHAGTARNLDTAPGDVAIWYLTTSHSGNVVRVRGMPSVCIHPRLERLIPQTFRIPEDDERLSIFCSFGTPGVHLDHYIDYQSGRADVRRHWQLCATGDEFNVLARARGITLRRPVADYGSAVVRVSSRGSEFSDPRTVA